MGCGQRCAFCSVRAYPRYPGDDVIYLYAGTAVRVEKELAERVEKPRAVFISPSTDPFPPIAEVQAETASVIEAVARQDVTTWLMTRGQIRPSVMSILREHRRLVRVSVALTTVDRRHQRMLEPLTAPPRIRLRQIEALRASGISTQVIIEPLVPGVTDTRTNLSALLTALANIGIQRVTASYMFLRPGIRDHLIQALQAHGLDEAVLSAFQGGPTLNQGPLAPAQYLSKPRRQRGYSALMALAADFGISVGISATTNPDFGTNSYGHSAKHSRPPSPSLF
jgi:DNA repair photolyase